MASTHDMKNSNLTNNNLFNRFLSTVERLGNLLPHPAILFLCFSGIALLVSFIAGSFNLSVPDPRPEGSAGRAEHGLIYANNLLTAEGLRELTTSVVTAFTGFAPLGTVLVALLGVSLAEHSGLFSAVIRKLILGASKQLVTAIVVFAGVISNLGAELGYVVLVPLAGLVFYSLGRHPIAGMAAAFAGVSGGYSANLFIGTVDPLLSGITQASAQLINPEYMVGPEVNWYFMFISTFFITIVGSWVSLKIVEPRLGEYDPTQSKVKLEEASMQQLTPLELKGLKLTGLTLLILSALIAYTVVPEDGIFRNQETGEIAGSPFLKSIVVFIMLFFGAAGLVYGRIVGTIKNSREAINAMSKSMATMSEYIVIVFFASQFILIFNETNLGIILAILGSKLLQSIGFTGPFIFIFFIIICGIINLSLGSASAQWAMMAPVFIPMFMLLGYAPEVTQAAYRIGDSVTNIITPMLSYFGLIVSLAAKYNKHVGVGTLIAIMLPYTIIFMFGWIVLFYVWVFLFKLPVGPGAPTYYTL